MLKIILLNQSKDASSLPRIIIAIDEKILFRWKNDFITDKIDKDLLLDTMFSEKSPPKDYQT